MTTLLILLALFVFGAALLYFGQAYFSWTLPIATGLGLWAAMGISSPFWFALAVILFAPLALLFGVPSLRSKFVTSKLLPIMKPMFPAMSDTEKTALDAGTVWWDADLFSGKPDWKKLIGYRDDHLSEKERAFLAGPVTKLCEMVDEQQVERDRNLTPEAWDFLKKEGFFGMIIPESYGGLGLSAAANSATVTMVSSRNIAAAVTVMVPNSLGPAELLLHYGTEDQKNHYLPRLASGEDVPAFALTEPGAGSDAASMTSWATVCRGQFEGKEVLGMNLNWDKRYITLAPVATLLGLAFKLYDPEGLIGDKEDLGITCALIPVSTPGVETGRFHDPLGVPFLNGPTTGKDVFVPLDYIIGGKERAGQGWRMLMDCLSAGRGISLPALSTAAAQYATRVTAGYSSVREQFGMPIGKFEGIGERLGRMGGMTYAMNAARRLTAASIDAGEKPAVLSAVIKHYATEGMRDVVNDGMDIVGGSGICRGPRNSLGAPYQAIPIGITVEGANILTRTLIIFGQGAIRCHPYAYSEIVAAQSGDLETFDRVFFKHIGHVFSNVARAKLLGLTGGKLVRPPVSGPVSDYFGKFSRWSAAFAFASEIAMATLGGALKRKECLTGRLADALAGLYFGSAALKRFVADGQPERDRALVRWSCEQSLFGIQEALRGLIANLPNRPAAWLLGRVVFPIGAWQKAPSDRLTARVAKALIDDGDAVQAMCSDIYVPPRYEEGFGKLEHALDLVVASRRPHDKIKEAVRSGELERRPKDTLVDRARAAGVIGSDDLELINEANAARLDVIQADAFTADEYLGGNRVTETHNAAG